MITFIISILKHAYYFKKYIISTFFEIAIVRNVLYDNFYIIINCLSLIILNIYFTKTFITNMIIFTFIIVILCNIYSIFKMCFFFLQIMSSCNFNKYKYKY